ncbi:retrovirus-related Pol polyprotein from transposon TNT 1-94 [Caerostris darwini]|uniref:Retrovirus-related Pol polyprotein from transposon TNT 1-94 n=1 Tax=Caerostris darwini TaxID=1538125 RepID=A0AAV4PGE7_9ARAC|nr:retrovirus-related Pol polyprotein from transposon TNT 1-94 [Caerostris darwini]
MDPTGTERFPLLNQRNWSTWKENMRFLLMESGCWSFIYGSEPKLEETSTLRESLKDATAAWKLLQEQFEPKSRASVIRLLDECFQIKFDAKKDIIATFTARIRKHVKRLMDAGHPLRDMYPAFQSIRTPPHDFQAKYKRVSFKPIGRIRSTNPLQLLHMHLCGPLPVESRGGAKYFLSITDDFSRMVICFNLKVKSQVFEYFKPFNANAKSVLIRKIISVRCDNEHLANRPEASIIEILVSRHFRDALKSPQSDKWQEAKADEFRVMKDGEVWELVPAPKNSKVIGCRWVYTLKKNEKGVICRYKARLVTQGHNQRKGETYEDTFSPVVNFSLIRMFL